jgi:polysaccharide export outer membrane protein
MRNGRMLLSHLSIAAVVMAVVAWAGLPAGSQPSPTGYLLGPGDALEVSVWGYPDLTRQVTIGPDDMIMLPLVGSISTSRTSVDRLRAVITKAYATYVNDPKVTVIIKEFRKIRVAVLGQVTRPGTYDLQPGARLLDFIAAAGGLTEAAATNAVQVMPPGGASTVADVGRALAGDPNANLPLRGGETLVVPEDLTNLFTVAGEVVRPGRYRIKGEMRVLDALVTAGGLTSVASLSEARLIRASGTSQDLLLDNLLLHQDLTANAPLQPGDTLVVPEATNNKFYVMGDVHNPGVFTMKGDVTMLQALAMAGGPEPRGMATAKTVYIVRRGGDALPGVAAGPAVTTEALPNGHSLIKADLQNLTQKGDRTADVPVRAGDVVVVPQTGLSGLFTFLSVLAGLGSVVRF